MNYQLCLICGILWLICVVILPTTHRPFPSNHIELEKKVKNAIARSPEGTFILALDSYGLPHGSTNYIWVEVAEKGGHISHRSNHYEGPTEEATKEITADEAQAILREVETRNMWNLPHDKHRIIDGYVCAIALGRGDRLHSIQIHYGFEEGRYWDLIDYIHRLSPIAR
jgi:hypothetical protein